MGRFKDRAELLADRMELPTDALCGKAKLTVNGKRRLLIENHRGIREYEDDRIVVDCDGAVLTVRGSGLTLCAMNGSDMLIKGSLLSVEFG